MNNNEWKELISKEFGVSKSVANKMLHAMYSVKRFRTKKKLKVTQCQGEGQGRCKRCTDKGKWNLNWMCFLYKIEGYEGCYCSSCVEEIEKENHD